MRHIISLKEQSKEDILEMLKIAQEVKKKRSKGELTNYLPNKTLIMLFEKTSTRTSQISLTDFKDEIEAVMRFGNILMFRAKKVYDVGVAAACNQIPVIDACSEKYHPAQALSDLLTMVEHSGGIHNIKKVVWLGIENNVSNTLGLVCAKLGIRVVIVAPEIDPSSVDEELNAQADVTGMIERTLDIKEALRDASYVHTDTWMNMEFFENGKVKPEFQKEYERKKEKFMPYQLNAKIINDYAPKAKIMHCMPCHI